MPVITLVILFSPEPWDGPIGIHEMLSVKNETILSFVPDYRINLIAPAHMDKTSMDKLRTSLREVLLYIKYSKERRYCQYQEWGGLFFWKSCEEMSKRADSYVGRVSFQERRIREETYIGR